MMPTGYGDTHPSVTRLSSNPYGVAGDRAGVNSEGSLAASEFSWGSDLSAFPDELPSRGGRYKATEASETLSGGVSVSGDTRI